MLHVSPRDRETAEVAGEEDGVGVEAVRELSQLSKSFIRLLFGII